MATRSEPVRLNPLLPFNLPDACCMCLGPAQTMHEIATPHGEDGKSGFIEFKVPLCRGCQSRLKRQRTIGGLIALVMTVGGGYSFWGTEGEPLTLLRGVGVGIFALGLMGLFYVFLGLGAPAVHMGDRIVFQNKEYHRLFEEANRQQPSWSDMMADNSAL